MNRDESSDKRARPDGGSDRSREREAASAGSGAEREAGAGSRDGDRSGTRRGSVLSRLSRRTVLTGLASTGIVGALAGAGTRANITDVEVFADDTLVAGDIELRIGTEVVSGEYVDEPRNTCEAISPLEDERERAVSLDELDAGDEGSLLVCLRQGGPSYVWMRLYVVTNDENGLQPAERKAGDTTEERGELASHLMSDVWIDPGCEGNASKRYSGTMLEIDAALAPGIRIGTPETTEFCLGMAWRLPQYSDRELATLRTDQVGFVVEFAAQQTRHNDDPSNPWSDT